MIDLEVYEESGSLEEVVGLESVTFFAVHFFDIPYLENISRFSLIPTFLALNELSFPLDSLSTFSVPLLPLYFYVQLSHTSYPKSYYDPISLSLSSQYVFLLPHQESKWARITCIPTLYLAAITGSFALSLPPSLSDSLSVLPHSHCLRE